MSSPFSSPDRSLPVPAPRAARHRTRPRRARPASPAVPSALAPSRLSRHFQLSRHTATRYMTLAERMVGRRRPFAGLVERSPVGRAQVVTDRRCPVPRAPPRRRDGRPQRVPQEGPRRVLPAYLTRPCRRSRGDGRRRHHRHAALPGPKELPADSLTVVQGCLGPPGLREAPHLDGTLQRRDPRPPTTPALSPGGLGIQAPLLRGALRLP